MGDLTGEGRETGMSGVEMEGWEGPPDISTMTPDRGRGWKPLTLAFWDELLSPADKDIILSLCKKAIINLE